MNWMSRFSVGCWLGVLGVGCSANGDPASRAASDATAGHELSPANTVEDGICGKDGVICDPKGLAFAQLALGVSDTCDGQNGDCLNPPRGSTTARLSQPEPGKICMAGSVKPGGWADLVLGFTAYDSTGTKVLKKLDAYARGMAKAAFTLDSPPSGGVKLEAAVVTRLECPANPMDCFTYGFRFMTAANTAAPVTFSDPGPQVAPFTHFKQTRTGVSQVFDTTALDNISFGVGEGAYDFCIHDFKFLDAAGNEVKP